jgi:hypothetical protein
VSESLLRGYWQGLPATVSPEQAGVPTYGARRVPGLRARRLILAGVSVPYYPRLG